MIQTVIGIISFNDLDYLKKTIPEVSGLPDSKVIVLDNAHNAKIKNFIKNLKNTVYLTHKEGNIGFAKGHNYILQNSPKSEYYFCLNSDVLVNKSNYLKCVEYLDKHKDVAMASGKLHYWDKKKGKKTDILDTAGIVGNKAHYFWDKGQGKEDTGQYDSTINNVFGVSGAAFIIRRNNIGKITNSDNILFDENMFMYKEDIDLAYKMRWLGLKIVMLPLVLGYHARTLNKNKKKSRFEAEMSYKNHLIMLKNNLDKRFSLSTKIQIYEYEFLKFMFYLVTKPKIALRLLKVIKMQNLNKSVRIVPAKKIEKILLK